MAKKIAEKHLRETLFQNNQWDSTFHGPQALRERPFCNLQNEGIKRPSPVSVDSGIVRQNDCKILATGPVTPKLDTLKSGPPQVIGNMVLSDVGIPGSTYFNHPRRRLVFPHLHSNQALRRDLKCSQQPSGTPQAHSKLSNTFQHSDSSCA